MKYISVVLLISCQVYGADAEDPRVRLRTPTQDRVVEAPNIHAERRAAIEMRRIRHQDEQRDIHAERQDVRAIRWRMNQFAHGIVNQENAQLNNVQAMVAILANMQDSPFQNAFDNLAIGTMRNAGPNDSNLLPYMP